MLVFGLLLLLQLLLVAVGIAMGMGLQGREEHSCVSLTVVVCASEKVEDTAALVSAMAP